MIFETVLLMLAAATLLTYFKRRNKRIADHSKKESV
jgi:hypothetical protein